MMTDPILYRQLKLRWLEVEAVWLLPSDYWELESGCGIGIRKEMLLFAISRVEIRNTKIREHGIVTGSVLGHRDLLRRGV